MLLLVVQCVGQNTGQLCALIVNHTPNPMGLIIDWLWTKGMEDKEVRIRIRKSQLFPAKLPVSDSGGSGHVEVISEIAL